VQEGFMRKFKSSVPNPQLSMFTARRNRTAPKSMGGQLG
jgi:hypothetical protein